MAVNPLRLGEALARGDQNRQQADAARQATEFNRRRMAQMDSEEAYQAQTRPLKLLGDQLALRGQVLGAVETPEDYARVLPMIQGAGLPTSDLPEDRKSTAYQTFQAPKPALSAMPSWMPQSWSPSLGLPAPETQLPAGEMVAPGVAPEEIGTSVARAARRGLTVGQQEQYSDKSIGRQLQNAQIAANLAKYEEQAAYRAAMGNLSERRFGLQETKDERDARLEQERLGLDRRRLSIQEGSAAREAAKPTLNEGQAKAVLFGQEVAASLVDFKDLLGKGFDPTSAGGAAGVAAASAGGILSPAKMLASDDAKVWNNARDQLAQAALRFESGAAIGEQEFGKKIRANIPSFNDPPVVVKRKLDAIDRAAKAFEAYTGKTFNSKASESGASPYKFTKSYQGATYGRNSDGEPWKLVK